MSFEEIGLELRLWVDGEHSEYTEGINKWMKVNGLEDRKENKSGNGGGKGYNSSKGKYNKPSESELLADYSKSRANNSISAFTTFSEYKKYKDIIETEIVGMTTSNGIKITGQTKHFIERVFGTTEDPSTKRPRSGVEIDDIKEAIINPNKTRVSENSVQFRTNKCSVSINPKTGLLIQTNPL